MKNTLQIIPTRVIKKLLMTMVVTNVAYAVATAMALTDGSLEYVIRK